MNNEISAALQQVFGEKPSGYYVAALIFSLIGIIISLYWSSKNRNKDNPTTPDKFSTWFLIWDTSKRVLVTLLVMFLIFRIWDITDILWMVGVGIGVALSLDKMLEYLMEKFNWVDNLLSKDRDNFPEIPKTKNDE